MSTIMSVEQAIPPTHESALMSLLGMALVGLRTAVEKHDADDQVLLNVEAGLREMGFDPDRLHREAITPDMRPE